ncbi:MAG: Ca-activated chloride channel family protein [Saprospiraceae bacterium]|jgi:Ca-activated chloride channel family protein
MKNITTFSLAFLFFLSNLHANGICIVNGETAEIFPLIETNVQVDVTNQIATVRTTQTFVSNIDADTLIKFGFPLTETGSALSLRWFNNGEWFEADFNAEPQDPNIPGGGGNGSFTDQRITNYLGETPLYFNLEQYVDVGDTIMFELTYVDLLPYGFNEVEFFHKNDYSELQSESIVYQEVNFNLFSDRTIDLLEMPSHNGATVINNVNIASLVFIEENGAAITDFSIIYELNADELGLFDFSTYLPDSTGYGCDDFGPGYLAFIVEPDPSENTEVISKIFTLIIDVSGSMDGVKIEQAKEAAAFITSELNPGDEFNVIAFDDAIYPFSNDHVPFNSTNESSALAFISNLSSGGTTNISGAFSTAIPQFSNSDPEKAQIIIFFTDGEASAGITDTNGILAHVTSVVSTSDVPNLSIFTFGIGESVNQQLLTLLALQNNGLVVFLENDELTAVLSEFYLTIQNPVLLNTQMTFDPPIVIEDYPQPLPNLFKGQQLIVVGRYSQASEVNVQLTGTAFGEIVEYNYSLNLADTTVQSLSFLPRLWAKKKMEYLYNELYSLPFGDPEQEILSDSIVNTSFCYGVLSPLTSFTDDTDTGGGGSTTETSRLFPSEMILNITPNPSSTQSFITFKTETDKQEFFLKVSDSSGHFITEFHATRVGVNEFVAVWDGLKNDGQRVNAGIYFVELITEDGVRHIVKIVRI